MTKQVQLTVCLFFICAFSHCQGFISNDKLWHVKISFWGDIITEIFKIEGDSIVNSITYNKIWSTSDSTLNAWYFNGLVREDGAKVYYKGLCGEEGLLYNFDLKEGDTTHVISMFCEDEQQLICSSIDTIEYYNVSRIKWMFEESYTEEFWIEGIGSSFGPFHSNYHNCICDVGFNLLCYYRSDTLRYIKEGEDDCFQYITGIEVNRQQFKANATPNPFTISTIFSYSLEKPSSITITIFNAQGQQVDHIQREQVKGNQQVQWNAEGLPAGMYYFRIQAGNKVGGGKIVKLD